jgi:uncharacterized protein (DUF2249 family)
MSQVTDAMRQHHQELLDHLSAQVEILADRAYDADPNALATFLKNELLPHAAGEERALYPVVDRLIKAHGTATATMSVDHQFLGDYVRLIDELARAIGTADPAARPALLGRLARYALQVEAIFRLHLQKEEDVYLPLFEQYVTPDVQQQVLDAMHETAPESAAETIRSLDVRQIPPPRRHELIFETFENLAPGAAFVLVNDHDPKPLFYQFKAEREGQFSWDYAEQGPTTWRVCIGKVKGPALV